MTLKYPWDVIVVRADSTDIRSVEYVRKFAKNLHVQQFILMLYFIIFELVLENFEI